MRVTLAEAATQLADLADRAQAGDEVVLTENGRDVLRLVPATGEHSLLERRRAALEKVAAMAAARGLPDDGVDAAHSQDFLYDEYGIPK